MPDPTGIVPPVAAAITASLTIATFIKDIKNTPADVKACFDLTSRVDEDLQYLISLRKTHEKYLSTVSDTANRQDRMIHATGKSILDICRLLEGCRKELYEGNTIPLSSRMKWVLGDSGAFLRRTSNLQQQHAAINAEIAYLRQLDMLKPLEMIATTTFENLELLSMGRKKRGSRFVKDDEHEPVISELGPSTSASATATVTPQLKSSTELSEQRNSNTDIAGAPVSTSTKSNIPPADPFVAEEEVNVEIDETEGNDPESAFYRDLRRKEDERQRRLSARRKHVS